MTGVLVDESGIRERWLVVEQELDERGRRMWGRRASRSDGWGGVAAVVRATGISEATVRRGIAEVAAGDRAPAGRGRRAGAGRKPILEGDPERPAALESLIDPVTRGDPESPLRWTSKSVQKLTDGLRGLGHVVHESTVRLQVKALGYCLQANRKTREGADHPDRDAQFQHIATVTSAALAANQPVLSIDTKKKELIGDYKNGGRELACSGEPVQVNTHDFPDKEVGKAVPYGIYDVGRNEGWVSVGISADTCQFAVSSIRGWWQHLGNARYPNADTLTITADSGGSNSPRVRLWKTELQKLADEIGLAIRVLHFPAGTSKWNKIEHRLFSYISINWRAKPLTSYQVVIDLIAATTTSTGLKVYARLDTTTYQTKLRVTDAEINAVNITRDNFHGEWNYTIHPKIPTVIKS